MRSGDWVRYWLSVFLICATIWCGFWFVGVHVARIADLACLWFYYNYILGDVYEEQESEQWLDVVEVQRVSDGR